MVLVTANGECVLRSRRWSIIVSLNERTSKNREGNSGFDNMRANDELDTHGEVYMKYFFSRRHFLLLMQIKLYGGKTILFRGKTVLRRSVQMGQCLILIGIKRVRCNRRILRKRIWRNSREIY